MEITVNLGVLSGIFAVPNSVVDKHIKLAGSAQLKVLLYICRHGGETFNIDKAAGDLGFSGADVKDALNYWREAGLLSEASEPRVSDNIAAEPDLKPNYTEPADIPTAPTPVIQSGNVKKVTSQYRPTQKEAFKRMEQSEEVRFIVNQAKVLLGRELNGSDVATIVAIFDWAGVSPDIILMAMEYCSSCGKTDMRSVERQCTYWSDHGITTHEMVDDYIKEKAAQNAHQGLIKSAFGISGRSLSSKECDFIRHWFDELNFDITMIKLAFDKTVDNTGKISFSYLNKILENWHSKGITTPMQAADEGAKKPVQSSSDASYDISAYDYESIYHTPKL